MIPMLDLRDEIAELKDEILAAVSRVLDSTAFILGPEVRGLEQDLSNYLGVKQSRSTQEPMRWSLPFAL
jgi:dTDP-4-amino-4,6-dideoxygalactose transaminase